MEVGFSGQNSVVESAHNRAPYCHLSRLYNGILRSCWSKTDGGWILRAEYSAHNRAPYCHFSRLYNGILRSCRSKTDGGGILRTEFCGGISPQPGAILSS